MKGTRSPQLRLSLPRGASLAATAAVAILSLSSCRDDPVGPPSPAEAQIAGVAGPTAGEFVQRPFEFSQQWEASGNDFTTVCIVEIPNPQAPGGSIQFVLPGLTHGWGTATHWGRHSVDIYLDYCSWDGQVGAIRLDGHAEMVVASGDTIVGTYGGYLVPSPTGADFTGGLVLVSGTGRFRNVTGEASLQTHDELDGSGRNWGSGWIAY